MGNPVMEPKCHPPHLRAAVARLTVAVPIERITPGAVVALTFLFTPFPVTAGWARIGADKSLVFEMFKKLCQVPTSHPGLH
jgi:hypothetical protein